MNPRPRILLDCDPGIDDAFAIFCAARFTELAAITTVSGNVRIENTTRNAMHVLELAGLDVPVHRGSAAPLAVPPAFAGEIHGSSGLGSLVTPEPAMQESQIDAVQAILDFCAGGDALIVATGPLTNIARAVQRDPSLFERVAALHWMGGSTGAGNKTAFAEFNAWADPHAVDVTFRSGIPLTMYGLNLTHQVRMTDTHIHELHAAGTTSSIPAAEFLTFYRERASAAERGQAMHDPCALLGLTHPALFTVESSPMVAHVDGERRGMTEERAPQTADPGTGATAAHYVARTADADRVLALISAAAIEPMTTP